MEQTEQRDVAEEEANFALVRSEQNDEPFDIELLVDDDAEAPNDTVISIGDPCEEVEFVFHPKHAPYIAREIIQRHAEWQANANG